MNRRIFYLDENDKTTSLQEEPFETEALLQQLLAKHPDLLAGELIDRDDPRDWILIKKEMGIPGEENGGDKWLLDHLYVDQDGIPTLVEVKKGANTDIRRKVVGQMLDYAANAVVYWPIETIKISFEAQCHKDGKSPERELERLLGMEADLDEFWKKVETNLQAGRIRMIFVADLIPPELRRIVEFLSTQFSLAEVFALELRRYVGEGMKTLVPQVYGYKETATSAANEEVSRQPIAEAAFFKEFDATNPNEEQDVARAVIAWGRKTGLSDGFKKGKKPAVFMPIVPEDPAKVPPFVLSCGGSLAIRMKYLKNKPPFNSSEARTELHSRLADIPGLVMKAKGIEGFPGFPLSALVDDTVREQVLKVLGWIVQEIRNANHTEAS